jgi:carbon-monoxide dehydrogenase medium subunit
MYPFDYHRATSVAEAAAMLAGQEEAKLLAGGMSLVPTLRHRLAAVSLLIDLNAVPDLRTISPVGTEGLRIGALATHYAVSTDPTVRSTIPALADLAGGIGDPLVRNRGTIGGSLANNDPAACYPAALLGLGGTVHTDRRSIPGDAFIVAMFETALERDEIITAVEFPRPDCACYLKLENPASRFGIVGVFVSRRGTDVRVGVTGARPRAFRAERLERALRDDFRPPALDGLEIDHDDLLSDIHASSDYRRMAITELSKRAVANCLAIQSRETD